MKGKQIAVMMAQADEPYQQELVRGIVKKSQELGYNVKIFSMYIKYQDNEEREVGDSNIFNLIPFNRFDALILFSDLLQTPGVERQLQERIHTKFSGPVVCVDTDTDYFYHFWTVGYDAVYAEVSHIIEKHHKKDIAYLTGRRNHVHSQRRLQAYRDAMEAHGLPVREDRIFYGDFWYTSGTGCAEALLRHRQEMPEAIVCANDCMAIGFADVMEQNGIKIPEDIIVAGYGTSDEGQRSPRSLTSTVIPAEYYGSFTVEAVDRMRKGENVPEPKPVGKLFIGESCGCHPDTAYLMQRRELWRTKDSEEGHESIHNHFMENLMLADTIDEFFHTVYESIHYLREVRKVEIALDPRWVNPDDLVQGGFFRHGYPSTMVDILSYDSENPSLCRVGAGRQFETRELIARDVDLNGLVSYFIPLYFEDKTYGYVALAFPPESACYETVTRLWLNTMMSGLEAFRRELVIQHLEKVGTVKNPMRMGQDPSMVKMGITITEDLTPEERLDMEETKKILDNNLLVYHFQPIVNAVDGEIYSYEALMRSGTDRKVSPLSILRYANMMGRLADVEYATFNNVLTYVEEHRDLFNGKKIFINSIPGCKLEYQDFVLVEQKMGQNSDVAVVEMTEQTELSDEELNSLKQQYRRMGIGMAIDDYGTGYSNISNLLRYMPDYVKIDRSLLSNIQVNSQKQHFVREIIDFCHSNQILALAEGVETAEELQTVIRLGTDLIQGYYVARPSAEILESVESSVRSEISRFHREKEDGSADEAYHAGNSSRISLSHLVNENKTNILIGDKDATFRDITIVGMPNMETNVHIEILEGYDGRITLENVCLSNIKSRPCIRMAEGSRVTLCLVGENQFKGGGVMVPESAQFAMEGNGNLLIEQTAAGAFAIGNAMDKRHGIIEFYQDGELTIQSSGQTAVGIGSGLGGSIKINKGKYVLHMNGDEGVAIGSFKGNDSILIHDCDIFFAVSFYKSVYIGSMEGKTEIRIWRSLVRCTGSSKTLAAIGTISGEKATVEVNDLAIHLDVRADYHTALGSLTGATRIRMVYAGFNYKGIGRQGLVYGGISEDTEMEISSSDITIDLQSDSGKITNAPAEKIKETYGRASITVNGVKRK